MSASGRRLQSLVAETNGQALVEAVRLIPGRVHLCLEEGTQSAWLYELLKPHVSEIVVSMPAKKKGAKDDSGRLGSAEELRVGGGRRGSSRRWILAGLRRRYAIPFCVTDEVRAKNRWWR
jgi:hypothetical protein